MDIDAILRLSDDELIAAVRKTWGPAGYSRLEPEAALVALNRPERAQLLLEMAARLEESIAI